jgi:hypothetical protein
VRDVKGAGGGNRRINRGKGQKTEQMYWGEGVNEKAGINESFSTRLRNEN